MVVWQDLTWPHLVPIDEPKTSHSTPNSLTPERPNPARTLLAQIQATQEASRHSSFGGGRSSTPIFHTITDVLLPQISQEPVHEPSVSTRVLETLLPQLDPAEVEIFSNSSPEIVNSSTSLRQTRSARTEGEAIAASYTLPPTPFTPFRVFVENSSPSHRRPTSPIVLARAGPADSAADSSDSYPESRWSFAQFQYGNRESFNTSVQALLQSRPDSPIGGQKAPPMMKGSHSPGKIELPPNDYFGPPRIEISSPPVTSKPFRDGKPGALRTRSNFSDPCYETASTMNMSRPQSPITGDKSPKMVTAPESPGFPADQRSILSDMPYDYDGPGLGETAVRDFAMIPDPDACKQLPLAFGQNRGFQCCFLMPQVF